MCKRADISREPGTDCHRTGTPSCIISSLLRLAHAIAAEIWRYIISAAIKMGLGALDEARNQFDNVKISLEYSNKSIPLSEGSEEFLATFAENYDGYALHSSPPGPLLKLAHP